MEEEEEEEEEEMEVTPFQFAQEVIPTFLPKAFNVRLLFFY